MRTIRPLAGSPRVRVLLRPAAGYGRERAQRTWGSNHVRYVGADQALRVTTDCSITALLEETPFVLRAPLAFLLGPDETLQGSVAEVGRRFFEETAGYWREWVRYLSIPFEWQDVVIRAAITLKLNAYDDTGAIIAAMTTSIPEAARSTRNWDYRYCWLRDGYFVVNALNRLGTTRTMERYLDYVVNIAAGAPGGQLQPVYRISGAAALEELSGPIDRGDVQTIKKHIEALNTEISKSKNNQLKLLKKSYIDQSLSLLEVVKAKYGRLSKNHESIRKLLLEEFPK